MNLKKALSGSALWYFQILARRIGLNRYRHYLGQCEYGNAQCGSMVDNFWLNESLLISPVEQLEFISKFAARQLPFPSEALQYLVHLSTALFAKRRHPLLIS
ncbi:MAG: penicillin-binding transpeptidase domain-containing protein [Pseudomonadota bacterium]